MSTNGSSEPGPKLVKRRPLRVLICFRAPLGGLFRHVADLTKGLVAEGVEVGIICDSEDLDKLSAARLADLATIASLGLHRTEMPRTAGRADFSAVRRVIALVRELDVDIVHGHGAKGGAYARIAAWRTGRVGVYTPHGGSLHYGTGTLAGRVFLGLERLLAKTGAAILFESAFSKRVYAEKIGDPGCKVRIIPNGLAPEEFATLPLRANAADIVYLGEMRELKGVHVLLQALAAMQAKRETSAVLVGSGPDRSRFEALAGELGLGENVRFEDPMPAREAFRLGRVVVVPSLAESFPYVVLEAMAAAKPVVATDVGGIPEMFGLLAQRLVPPDDAEALADAMATRLEWPEEAAREAGELQSHVRRHFSTQRMVGAIFGAYTSLIARATRAGAASECREAR